MEDNQNKDYLNKVEISADNEMPDTVLEEVSGGRSLGNNMPRSINENENGIAKPFKNYY